MQLHELQLNNPLKRRIRIGRGGKRGNYSGRCLKGQKSRSGRNIRPAERDLIIRIPKLRGYNNHSIKEKPIHININDLSRIKGQYEIIDKDVLVKEGLVRATAHAIKVLSDGEITKSFQCKGMAFSKSAKTKIEAAGGKVLE